MTTLHSDQSVTKYGGMMNKTWDELWKENQTPWDTKMGHGMLKHLVENVYNNRSDIEQALIPGCGNGYEADIISGIKSLKNVTGLDISQTAVDNASKVCSVYCKSSHIGRELKHTSMVTRVRSNLCVETSSPCNQCMILCLIVSVYECFS